MATVIEFPKPTRIKVPTFDAAEHVKELLDVVTVPAVDPHVMSYGELVEVTRTHLTYCACSFCEELVLRDLANEV